MLNKPDKKITDTSNFPEKITFLDLFSIDDIQRLQDEFSQATGVASIITTPDGIPITEPSNFCRFCSEIIRKTEKGLLNCYKSDAVIGRPNPDGPTVQTCMSGGLWDAGAGITVEGKHIANWLIGQVRNETKSDAQMTDYAYEIGVDENDFLAEYRKVPAMSLERFKNIASMLFTLANQLSSVAYQNVKQTRLIKKLQLTETELRQNQQELLTSEHRLSIVVDNLTAAMIYQVEISPDGKRTFTYLSENVHQLNEVTAKSVMNDANVLYRQIHPDDLPELIKAEQNAVKQMSTFRHEVRSILPSGKLKWFQLTSSPRKIANGIIAWDGIEIDITERKNTEEEHIKLEGMLRQSQKIEAIGQLAGGIAHDLNNLLAPIIGYAELLLINTDRKKDDKKAIGNIIDAGFKARDLVQQLLAFSRKQTLKFGPVDLNSVVDEFKELLRRTIREDIEFVTIKAPEVSLVQADTSQLEQVIMNLVVNAQDAMPEGGKITLKTRNAIITDENQNFEIDVLPGNYMNLSISDTGVGISPEIKEKIFEPFFSTKGKKGTGLGLATVYGIIIQHNGTISISSEPAQGTDISIYLPVSEDNSLPEKSDDITRTVLEGSETLLLVEDNKQVLEITEAILKQKGYSVFTADNGEHGLKIVQKHNAFIDLLVTDVVMPKMNGKDLFLNAQKIKPALRVLYMSGYDDDVISHQGMLEKDTNFIQKPFSISALCIKIREVLDSNQ